MAQCVALHCLAVPFLPDAERARFLIQSFGGWFGPPAFKLGDVVLDGRKRLIAWKQLAMPEKAPILVARTRREAGRLLVLAHHFDRAHELLQDSIPYNLDTATLLRVPPELAAGLVAHVRGTRKRRRPAPRRRQEVIDRLRCLYLDTIERGHELRAADLRDVLGEWA